jgi:hypothetical protein
LANSKPLEATKSPKTEENASTPKQSALEEKPSLAPPSAPQEEDEKTDEIKLGLERAKDVFDFEPEDNLELTEEWWLQQFGKIYGNDSSKSIYEDNLKFQMLKDKNIMELAYGLEEAIQRGDTDAIHVITDKLLRSLELGLTFLTNSEEQRERIRMDVEEAVGKEREKYNALMANYNELKIALDEREDSLHKVLEITDKDTPDKKLRKHLVGFLDYLRRSDYKKGDQKSIEAKMRLFQVVAGLERKEAILVQHMAHVELIDEIMEALGEKKEEMKERREETEEKTEEIEEPPKRKRGRPKKRYSEKNNTEEQKNIENPKNEPEKDASVAEAEN